MSMANGGFLALLVSGAAAVSVAGCGGDSSARTATGFGGPAGSGAAAGTGPAAGSAGGSGAAASSNGGQAGFFLSDASNGTGGTGGHAGTASGADGSAAASGTGGDPGSGYPDVAAGSGAWASWTGMSVPTCSGSGCGTDASLDRESPTCAGDAQEGGAITMDVLIVFDNSSSMSCDVAVATCRNGVSGTVNTRIAAVRDAINGFVSSPTSADIRVGLEAFPPADPLAEQCTWDYSKPDIPITPAKDAVTTFSTVLGGLTPHLNTPTEQALGGAYTYAKAYMASNPGRAVAVVLVTDGMPFACGNDETGARSAALATAAFGGSPSIKTYVVGLGNVATLDAIALGGTGGVTHYIEANSDATAKIQALLKTVTSTITCDYKLPTGGAVLDFGEVNVRTRAGDAGYIDLYKVDTAAACAAKGGWFYDVNPPGATPTKISLCPTSCDLIKAASSSSLQIIIGCATMSIH
jgi:hypothetical protein